MPNENNFSAPLLPCPFCGASAAVQNESTADNSGGYFVECKSCGASTNLRYACGDDPVPLLVAQWNARAPQTVEAQAAPAAVAAPLIARSLAEWHEDDGAVAWWAWCGHSWAGEAPFIGMPCDSDWPGYHTHWTPAPSQPAGLNATPKPPATEDSSAGDPAEVLAEPVVTSVGWREQFSQAVYADLAAADNQDVPLEDYPGRILKVLDSIVGPHHPTVVHWRNDAIRACIEIVKRYGAGTTAYQERDMAALYTAPQAQPADALDAAPVAKRLLHGHEPWEIPAQTIQRDAVRYRWLRTQFWDEGSMCVVMNPKSHVVLGAICPSHKQLDSAIDAAMAAAQEGRDL
ncbi:Lar family restriction alleviation protein [Comamonas sp. MYb396]|uniref:Lar family restriction alleviation protein n=1 Tax=Comamonas sp. MYb396 TaxID=2745302 RepID=UPI0030A43205